MIQMSPNNRQSRVVTHERLASLQGCLHNWSIFDWSDNRHPTPPLHQIPTKKDKYKRYQYRSTKRLHIVLSAFLRGCLESSSLTLLLSHYNSQQPFPVFKYLSPCICSLCCLCKCVLLFSICMQVRLAETNLHIALVEGVGQSCTNPETYNLHLEMRNQKCMRLFQHGLLK